MKAGIGKAYLFHDTLEAVVNRSVSDHIILLITPGEQSVLPLCKQKLILYRVWITFIRFDKLLFVGFLRIHRIITRVWSTPIAAWKNAIYTPTAVSSGCCRDQWMSQGNAKDAGPKGGCCPTSFPDRFPAPCAHAGWIWAWKKPAGNSTNWLSCRYEIVRVSTDSLW